MLVIHFMFLNAMCTFQPLIQLKSQKDYHCLFSFSGNTLPLAPQSFCPHPLFSLSILLGNSLFLKYKFYTLSISQSAFSPGWLQLLQWCLLPFVYWSVPIQWLWSKHISWAISVNLYLDISVEPQSLHIQSRILYNFIFLPSLNPIQHCLYSSFLCLNKWKC